MNLPGSLLLRLRGALDGLAQRIDALQGRERASLALAALALLLAIEWTLVRPLQQRRIAVATAGLQAEQELNDNVAAGLAAADNQRSELEATLRTLELELQARGAGKMGGDDLTNLLQRLLAREPARIEALRELALEEIEAAAVAAPPADATPAAPVVALYRHRFELTLRGDAAGLVSAVRALDRGARPLRIDRVRLATDPAGTLRATLTLSVVGTERTWLSI